MTWAITSNKGTCNSAGGSTFNIFQLSSQTPTEQEILVRVIPADTSDIGIVARYNSTTQFYYGVLTGGNTLAIGVDNSGFSTLASAGFSYSAGTAYWLRFRLAGTSLFLRGWADGGSEPSSWNVTKTDATFSSGGFGLGSDSSGATNTQFDQFTATDGTSSRTITATAALLQTSTRTISSTAALLQTSTRTISSTAALEQTSTRTIPCTTALEQTSTRTITSTAALELTSTRTISTTAALELTSARTISSTAALEQTSIRTIGTTAAFELTSSRTISSSVALELTGSRTIPFVAALEQTSTRTVPALASLEQTSSRTIPCTASLAGNIRIIPCTAALSLAAAPAPTNCTFYVRSGNATFYAR